MAFFDCRMISPTRVALVDALTRAAEVVDLPGGLLDLDDDHWFRFVAEVRSLPEGRRQWKWVWDRRTDARLVGVAWWTDSLRRRHFRVWAGHSSDGSFTRLLCPENDPRPPLWDLYPDRLFRRTRGEREEWLVVCPCGACGTPDLLRWTGHSCGRCYENTPVPPSVEAPPAPPRTFFHEGSAAVSGLAFSPGGRTLAASSRDGRVRLWDVAHDTAPRLLHSLRGHTRGLAFSPNGQALAWVGTDQTLHLADPATGQVVAEQWLPFRARGLAFAPDGLSLALFGAGQLEIWERVGQGTGWLPAHSRVGRVSAVAYSPAGDLLAVGGWGGRLGLIGAGGRGQEQPAYPGPPSSHFVYLLGFTPDGEDLISLSVVDRERQRSSYEPDRPEDRLQVWDVPTREGQSGAWIPPIWGLGHLFSWPPGDCLIEAPDRHTRIGDETKPFVPQLRAFSGEGDWLATAYYSLLMMSRLPTDLATTCLQWDPREELTCVAFSPDGRTLATGGRRGTIKLWPWRRLLEA
jgi:WD40 repeat protein